MIGKAIFNMITGGLVDAALDAFKAYQNKEISEAEFEARVRQSAAQTVSDVEQAWAEAAAKIVAETQETVRASFKSSSWVTRNAWAYVVFSQTSVLLWYQVGVPAFVYLTGDPWPPTGDLLLQWAYALVGGALGIGWMQQNAGSSVRLLADKILRK